MQKKEDKEMKKENESKGWVKGGLSRIQDVKRLRSRQKLSQLVALVHNHGNEKNRSDE